MTGQSLFLSSNDEEFDSDNNFIELADGSRNNGIVQGSGKAQVLIHDSKGSKRKVMLENALYVPSYKQDIILGTSSDMQRGVS